MSERRIALSRRKWKKHVWVSLLAWCSKLSSESRMTPRSRIVEGKIRAGEIAASWLRSRAASLYLVPHQRKSVFCWLSVSLAPYTMCRRARNNSAGTKRYTQFPRYVTPHLLIKYTLQLTLWRHVLILVLNFTEVYQHLSVVAHARPVSVCVRIFMLVKLLFSLRKRGNMFTPALVCVSVCVCVCDHDN